MRSCLLVFSLSLSLVSLAACHRRSPTAGLGVASVEVTSDVASPTRDVKTDRGVVRGVLHGASYAYRGIPYAAPPTGARRFAPPEDVAPWTSPREARDFGACCPQSIDGKVEGEEDCLTLNVWTPKAAQAKPRPVLVFIHGGGNVQGCSWQTSGGQRSYEADELAARGDAVVVSMNYRLGALGFFVDKGVGKGNWGIRDQAAALAWVKRNIAAFGGDPSRVLLFGESAGAEDTCAHLVSPGSRGLFTRALMESGMCPIATLAQAEQQGEELAKKLRCTGDAAACLREKSADEIVKTAPGATLFEKGFKWAPAIDGDVIPSDPMAMIAAGKHAHVPFVVGDNADETLLWVKGPPLGEIAYKARIHEMLGKEKGDAVLARYPVSAYPDAKMAFVAATTDAVFLCPGRSLARAMAKTQTEPVYRYLFTHVTDVQKRHADSGAAHGVELLFVFHHLHPSGYQPSPAEEKLSTTMMDDWARFADKGESGAPWPRYDATSDPYLVIDEPTSTGHALHADACDLWDGLALPR